MTPVHVVITLLILWRYFGISRKLTIIVHWLKSYLLRKHPVSRPTWSAVIKPALANKQAVICILRELARQGDARTARAVCRRTWFEDSIIQDFWFYRRARYFAGLIKEPWFVNILPSPQGMGKEYGTRLQLTPVPNAKDATVIAFQSGYLNLFNPREKLWICFHLECVSSKKIRVPEEFDCTKDKLYVLISITLGRIFYVQEVSRWNIELPLRH